MARKKEDEIPKEIVSAVKAIETQGLGGILMYALPILRLITGAQTSNGSIDWQMLLSTLASASGQMTPFEVTPRNIYNLLDDAVLDGLLANTPEAQAFIASLRSEIKPVKK